MLTKSSRDRYNLLESTKNYVTHLRGIASGRGGAKNIESLTDERARLAKEQADSQELKNAIMRGEYVSATEVEFTWCEIMRRVRSKVISVPSRVQQMLAHLTVHDVETIDRELRAALEDVADDDK